jgi:hypothetical protein
LGEPEPAVVVASLAIGKLLQHRRRDGSGQRRGGVIVCFQPPALERLDGGSGTADSIWIGTASSAHAANGYVAAAVATRLAAPGYLASSQEICVIGVQDAASRRSVLAIAGMLGLLVVAIVLMGLASVLSMASSSGPVRSAFCSAGWSATARPRSSGGTPRSASRRSSRRPFR